MKKLISALKILVLVILGFFLLAWIAIIFDKKAS